MNKRSFIFIILISFALLTGCNNLKELNEKQVKESLEDYIFELQNIKWVIDKESNIKVLKQTINQESKISTLILNVNLKNEKVKNLDSYSGKITEYNLTGEFEAKYSLYDDGSWNLTDFSSYRNVNVVENDSNNYRPLPELKMTNDYLSKELINNTAIFRKREDITSFDFGKEPIVNFAETENENIRYKDIFSGDIPAKLIKGDMQVQFIHKYLDDKLEMVEENYEIWGEYELLYIYNFLKEEWVLRDHYPVNEEQWQYKQLS